MLKRNSQSLPLSLPSSPDSQVSKKRKRQPSESSDGLPLANATNGQMKTRRIDPDRLAVRLGPELAAEMDAFIVPGAKMPSFQVRQHLVQKYNVDRRHIYDYFHSRGLRVAKEDKHSNLSNRMRKAAASRKPSAAQTTSSDDITPAKLSSNAPAPRAKPLPVRTKKTNITAKRRKSTKSPQIAVIPRVPSPSPMMSSSPPPRSPDTSDSADTSSSSENSEDDDSPVVSSFEISTQPPTYDEAFELELVSHGYPASEELCKSFGLDFCLSPSLSDSSDDNMFEFNEIQSSTEQLFAIPHLSVRDSLLPLEDPSLLSQDERITFYNLVNKGFDSMGVSEQSAGTYTSYMDRLYSDCACPVSPLHDNCDNSQAPTLRPVSHSIVQPREAPTAHSPPPTISKENRNPDTTSDPRPPNHNHYYTPQSVPLHRGTSNYISLSPRRQIMTSNLAMSQNLIHSPQNVRDSEKIASAKRSRNSLTNLVWKSPIKHVSSPTVSSAPTSQGTSFVP